MIRGVIECCQASRGLQDLWLLLGARERPEARRALLGDRVPKGQRHDPTG